MKLLFVCTGNTCRSPMAEGLMNDIAKKDNLDIMSLSAGVCASVGQRASAESLKVMEENFKIDIGNHRARQISPEFMNVADYVITMTSQHKIILQNLYPDYKDKIITMSEFAGETGDVLDPFGRSEDVYSDTACQIKGYIEKGITLKIKNKKS